MKAMTRNRTTKNRHFIAAGQNCRGGALLGCTRKDEGDGNELPAKFFN